MEQHFEAGTDLQPLLNPRRSLCATHRALASVYLSLLLPPILPLKPATTSTCPLVGEHLAWQTASWNGGDSFREWLRGLPLVETIAAGAFQILR
jgi:hypothetical protein